MLDDTDVMGEQPYTLEVTSPRRRPPADAAAPLAPQRRPAGQGDHSPTARRVTGRIARQRRRRASTLDVDGSAREVALRRRRQGAGPDRVQPQARTTTRRRCMDIDLSILRMLEREKEISFDVLVEAIEQALLTAYHKTPRAPQPTRASSSTARPATSPCSAAEIDDEGNKVGGVRRHPRRASAGSPRPPRSRSCCSGCATPRTTSASASSPARRATSSPASSSRAATPTTCMVDLGKLEALLPLGERVPGESYEHGTRIKCLVVSVRKGMRGPADHAVAHPPQPGQEALRPRGARDRRRHRRDRGDRPRGRPPHQDRGALDRARASTPRAPASARWASGCAT